MRTYDVRPSVVHYSRVCLKNEAGLSAEAPIHPATRAVRQVVLSYSNWQYPLYVHAVRTRNTHHILFGIMITGVDRSTTGVPRARELESSV